MMMKVTSVPIWVANEDLDGRADGQIGGHFFFFSSSFLH